MGAGNDAVDPDSDIEDHLLPEECGGLISHGLRLGELGWTEGRNLAIEYRWAEGRGERYVEYAAEFVRLKVDVIVTGGSAIPVAMRASSTIPIVFALAVDPMQGVLLRVWRGQAEMSPGCQFYGDFPCST